MKSDRLLLVLMVISGLFYFSEGKPCPEDTQPHKSRCDVYLKCVILPSNTHVWIPEKCEEGLIYEPSMRMCVLPGDDWECNLEELNRNTQPKSEDNVVFERHEVLKRSLDSTDLNDSTDSIDSTADEEKDSESEEVEDDDDSAKESDYIIVDESESGLVSERDLESSGDGEGTDYILLDTLTPEGKTGDENTDPAETTTPTKIDPNLTAHLQRLTQLIDGLKQTYQNKDSAAAELRPDQLNAFLAHYNIKAQLDSIDPAKEDATAMKQIDPLKQNQSLEAESETSTASQLDPETKVILTNQSPNGYNIPHPNDGYSNSQIVVNKPEGSVLFTLGHKPQDSTSSNHRYEPKISEDTLKTVLQLSKQMLDNQEVRRVVPSSAYYPQVIQPIYLPPPIPQYANSAFNQHSTYDSSAYDKFNYLGSQARPVKSGTTIIHNNVHVPSSDDRVDQVDSYGQKLHSYPPLPTYHYSSEGSSEEQDHSLNNRFENNQLVTIRPSKGYSNHQSTTTSRPYVSDTSGSTLFDYYTPSPHLDESNVNNVFQMEKYPTLNIGSASGRPPTRSHKRPDSHQHKSQFYQNSYHNSYHHPSQQSILKLFPTHIDPSKVKIRPNSQKLESMEQDVSDDNEEEEDDYAQSSVGSSGDDNHSETYNRYNANKQITASQLAQYVGHLAGGKAPSHSHQIYGNSDTAFFHQNEDESQLGSYGNGNDLTYDLINRKITPSISYDSSRPDASSCPVGIRQPNATECTRYYVCSKEDGRVMQYSCPSFTAFNPQTRICDAQYYAICHPTAIINRYTVSENQRVQLEAIKALHDAKRIREQVLRAQNIALRLRLRLGETHPSSSSTPSPAMHQQYSSDVLSNFLQNAIDSNSVGTAGSSDKDSSYSSSVSQLPNTYTMSSSSAAGGNRKRKYYCKEGDKVGDQTSIYNYFVCYKNSQGMMKGHKMTCSEGLLFCPMTSMCTLPRKCS